MSEPSERDEHDDAKSTLAFVCLIIGLVTTLVVKGLLGVCVHVVIVVPIALLITVWRGKPLGPSTYRLTAWLLFASGLWALLMQTIIAGM
jgi:hypothetical protein